VRYDIHITRAKDWTEAKSVPIHLVDAFAEAKTPDGILLRESGACGMEGVLRERQYALVRLQDGRVTVKKS
jgi:hypothetical protein